MTDATANAPGLPGDTHDAPVRASKSLYELDALTRKRNASEMRFKSYGIIAVVIGLSFLIALLYAILSNGTAAFTQTFVEVSIPLDQAKIEAAEASVVKTTAYNALIDAALQEKLAAAGITTDMKPADLRKMLSSGAATQVREHVLKNPGDIGKTVSFDFQAPAQGSSDTKADNTKPSGTIASGKAQNGAEQNTLGKTGAALITIALAAAIMAALAMLIKTAKAAKNEH